MKPDLESLLHRCDARIRRRIAGRLGRALGRHVELSDVVQSALYRALRDFDGFEGQTDTDFVRWVGSIAENRLRMRARYHRAGKRRPSESVGSTGTEAVAASPSSAVRQREDLTRVGRSLSRLPADYRRVILLRAVEGLDYDRVAQRLGRSVAATRTLLCRARTALCLEIEAVERDARGAREPT